METELTRQIQEDFNAAYNLLIAFFIFVTCISLYWLGSFYSSIKHNSRAGQPYSIKASTSPPRISERLLLLIMTKAERANIPGDLEEEFKQIAAKHGARYAKLWYYKQVAASAWPLVRKAVGRGLLASIGAWIRRYI